MLWLIYAVHEVPWISVIYHRRVCAHAARNGALGIRRISGASLRRRPLIKAEQGDLEWRTDNARR